MFDSKIYMIQTFRLFNKKQIFQHHSINIFRKNSISNSNRLQFSNLMKFVVRGRKPGIYNSWYVEEKHNKFVFI